jgi:hypothetical protein
MLQEKASNAKKAAKSLRNAAKKASVCKTPDFESIYSRLEKIVSNASQKPSENRFTLATCFYV